MTEEDLFQFLIAEYERPFTGWDFSFIRDRMVSGPLDWSYASLILAKIRRVKSLLDLGTGGGEKLARFAPLPLFTCATEGYSPNLPVARARLEPMGVQVFPHEEGTPLPFAEEQFDLVISRHESYSPGEVWRVLKPGKEFITQQVGAENDMDINRLLGAPLQTGWEHWNLKYAVDELQEAGFEIVAAREQFPYMRIFDAGALVYYLKAIPWQIPDFSVEKYYEPLARVDKEIQKNGYVEVKNHRFLIVARKPSSIE